MLVGWNAFHAAHAKSFMVYADLLDAGARQAKFSLLGTYLKALPVQGAYALLPEGAFIRVAFERKDAARAFTQAMCARSTAREARWAGQWAFVYDDLIVEKIKSLLPPPAKRLPPAAA